MDPRDSAPAQGGYTRSVKCHIAVHLYEPATGVRGIEYQEGWGHDANPITGEPYPPTPEDELVQQIIYWWIEGNGGCTCNRSLSIDRATTGLRCTSKCMRSGGKDAIDECAHYSCSSGRLIIIEQLFVNGVIVYNEDIHRSMDNTGKDEPDQ